MDTTLNLSTADDLQNFDFNKNHESSSLQDLLSEFTKTANQKCQEQDNMDKGSLMQRSSAKETGHCQDFIIKIRKGLPFKHSVNLVNLLPQFSPKKQKKIKKDVKSPGMISTAHCSNAKDEALTQNQDEDLRDQAFYNESQAQNGARRSMCDMSGKENTKGVHLLQTGRKIHKSMAHIHIPSSTDLHIPKIHLPNLTVEHSPLLRTVENSPLLKTQEPFIPQISPTSSINEVQDNQEEAQEQQFKYLHLLHPSARTMFKRENQKQRNSHDGIFNHNLINVNDFPGYNKKRYSEKIELKSTQPDSQPESPLFVQKSSDLQPNFHHPMEPRVEKSEGGYRKSLFGGRVVKKAST